MRHIGYRTIPGLRMVGAGSAFNSSALTLLTTVSAPFSFDTIEGDDLGLFDSANSLIVPSNSNLITHIELTAILLLSGAPAAGQLSLDWRYDDASELPTPSHENIVASQFYNYKVYLHVPLFEFDNTKDIKLTIGNGYDATLTVFMSATIPSSAISYKAYRMM